jgi:hypothetical protein
MNTDVRKFYDALQKDTALQQKLVEAAQGDVNRLLEAASKAAATMGYSFTVDEAKTFVKQTEEIPDELLDAIAAGNFRVDQNSIQKLQLK